MVFWYFSFVRVCSNYDLQLSHTCTGDIVNQDQSCVWAVADLLYYFFIKHMRPFGRVIFVWLTESACDVYSVNNLL